MHVYRIFRMKDAPRQQFRWAPHTSGVSLLKPRDFEPAGEVEADGVYAAWAALQASPGELRIGDVLENPAGELRIYKYVGFEEAQWVIPEVKSTFDAGSVAPPDPHRIWYLALFSTGRDEPIHICRIRLIAMRCSPIGVTPINSFALVTYMPEPLSSFLNGLRAELVSQCTIESHVTLLPPRPIPTNSKLAWTQVSDHLRNLSPFEIGFGDVEIFPVTNVIYLSITTGRESLERLHRELNHTNLAYREPFEYHPHLTLAQTLLPEQVEGAFALARQRWAEFPHARFFRVETLTFVQNTEKNQWVDLAELNLNGHRR